VYCQVLNHVTVTVTETVLLHTKSSIHGSRTLLQTPVILWEHVLLHSQRALAPTYTAPSNSDIMVYQLHRRQDHVCVRVYVTHIIRHGVHTAVVVSELSKLWDIF
jgi:hypothetical protein